MQSSDPILARLTTLHPKSIDMSLGRIEALLAGLGHPERQLAPVVHVAGTNGKGSTLATLEAILRAAGLRVHRYISPHLVRFNERIGLYGQDIDEAELVEVLETAERVNDGRPITFFEITTAAAFLAFARHSADYVLLETGLGGRLDTTNVVERPRLTGITPISIDHQEFLGDTIAAIAFEKAGILKPGVPCVVGPQVDDALAVIVERAGAVGAPLLLHGRDWSVEARDGGMRVRFRDRSLDLPVSALPGVHQVANAGLGVALALALDERRAEPPEVLARGLAETVWPARLQRLGPGHLSALLPDDTELWLDGGHNLAAGAVLAESMAAMAPRRLHLVVGMMAKKDLAGFLTPLLPLAASITTSDIPGEAGARSAEACAAVVRSLGRDAAIASDPVAALRGIDARPGDRVLVCGSLYLAGTILRRHREGLA
ncbi:bifunctional folylpolyglutamate synthase/dihydrofolate synthase [Marinivivus vitaminiproducens]|uniref:bifunctional folylpolyglutamate synthase/dihydrofolate synthase n=1 Tax=Marinivivus vitaminiproducens TaxID=3035935 RepID=UPI0027A61F05|nr:bifunctional folylpolyglutamate synthase/dihydrofolate synthase [Geminicoccaceae bacterium SCSIO 64248]